MVDYEILSEEYVKCYSDKSRIYMIEHYLKTYDATQRKQVNYTLFPRQKKFCLSLANGNNCVCQKPRQCGATTTGGAFIACECVLADPSEPLTVLVIGNTLDLAQQMVTKIRDFLYQFPAWMWGEQFIVEGVDPTKPPTKKQLFDICNTKEIVLKNGCRIVARSSGPDASRGVGGVSFLVFDEAAFIENGKDVYASALPTVSTGGRIIMISTPNGKDQLYYETCRQAKLKGTSGWNNFELVEFKWFQDPRYNKHLEWTRKNNETGEYDIIKEPTLNKAGDIKYDEDRWEELVKDGWKPRSPWYVKMCQQFNNDSQKIAQELDVSFLGSDSTVVAPEFIQMQLDLNVREPNPDYKDNVLEDMWIWKPPYEGHRYVISVDNSRGSSDDATALEIIDLDGIDDDGLPCVEQVAEYNGKLTGDIIGEIAYNYGMMYNCAFIVVEDIGGYGSATLLTLQNLKYPNLYYDDPNLKKYTSQEDATTIKITEKGLPGFHSSSVRFQMLSHFANLVKTNQFKIRSKRVISELDTWIFKNGRIDHKDGCHDDTLTCLAIGLFVIQYSMNKQLEAKQKDAVILQSMINLNNRIKYTSLTNTNNSNKKFVTPIYTANSFKKNSTTFDANMWLFK
jgi:hypothetical protein